MTRCLAESCGNWTGDGCICQVLDLEPVDVSPCRDCGAEGFRLTDGRCDGCHAAVQP